MTTVKADPARHTAPRPRIRDVEFLPAALEIVETPPSPTARWTALTIAALFVIAVAWSCFGRLDIVAVAAGKVIPSGRVKLVQPFETGVVRAILVRDGQAVKQGEALLLLDPTLVEADGERAARELAQARLDIARLRALVAPGAEFAAPEDVDARLVAVARRYAQAQADEQTAKLAMLDRQIEQRRAEIGSVTLTIARLQAELPLVSERAEIRAYLSEKKLSSRLMTLEAEQQRVGTLNEIKVQTEKRAEAEAGAAALERDRARSVAEFSRTVLAGLTEAETRAAGLEQEVIKAAQKRALQTLRAPTDGRVQQLQTHTVGGVVTPAQHLMVIVPDDAHLEIEARIENKDVGFVHVGQPVEVKVDAFNFTRYGLLRGTVTDITRDAVDEPRVDPTAPGGDGARPASATSVYIARIALASAAIETENGATPIGPGMSVTAEIKTGRRRVIEYLLSPLSRYAQESARER